ncbi:MAG: type IV CRISPR-associated protein Csf2 [Rhodospirillales bacterium]|nr:type IV CRISPR-associated protein Csf2 [Acetobacter sp.]
MYVIRGILRLTAPLHIAAPRKESVDPETDRLLPSGERGIAVVPTTKYRLPMFVRGSRADGMTEEAESKFSGNAFADVPVIPANDLRGRLRRCAARKVFDVLVGKNEQISLDAYHGMTCGAVTGSPNGRLSFVEAAQATRHPFLGLFGGGPKMVRSALQVSTGWPILASTIFAGVVSEELQAEVPCPAHSEWLLTQRLFFRRIDDAIRFTDGHAETVVRDFGPEVSRWIESVSAVKKARVAVGAKTAKAKVRNTSATTSLEEARDAGSPPPKRLQLQGFNALEFVVPGTRFLLEFHLEDALMRSGGLGLFLHALRELVLQQNLGGWTKNGFGRFELSQVMFRQSGSEQFEHPLFAMGLNKGEFNEDLPLIVDALDNWAEAAASLSAAEIEKLYELQEE